MLNGLYLSLSSVFSPSVFIPSFLPPSLSLYLSDPCHPPSFPGAPGLGDATNTISVMLFAAWMKERRSWLSKSPQHCSGKRNPTLDRFLGSYKRTAPHCTLLPSPPCSLTSYPLDPVAPYTSFLFLRAISSAMTPRDNSRNVLTLTPSPKSVAPPLPHSPPPNPPCQMGQNYCIIKCL